MGPYKSQQEFIDAIVPGAQEAYAKYGVYASVTIGQALWEAGWQMTQPVAYKDNNLFGVKYPGNHDTSITITQGTWATDDGGTYAHYESISDSVKDHGYFLRNNSRYTEAGAFSATTPQGQADAISSAGYASEGGYGEAIKNMIASNDLQKYDTGTYTGTTGTTNSSSNTANFWDKVKVTEHKSMSYFGASVQQPTTSNLNAIKNMFDKHSEDRHYTSAPPGYYDSTIHPHRLLAYQLADETQTIPLTNGEYDISALATSKETAMATLNGENIDTSQYACGDTNRIFRIGDCYFVIPPEFITVNTKTTNDEIQPLRQSGSVKIKNGYSRKEIQVSLLLNGMNQINGYEVSSPFDFSYYVDGLRNLISQFKYTPFVPIENAMINLIHGVDNVALRNINVETVAGFPECLQVTISMQEFNASPYTRAPNDVFGDSIDWDLYRYYTQKPLLDSFVYDKKKPKKYAAKEHFAAIATEELTAGFKFSVLTQEALDSAYAENIDENSKYKDTYYEEKNGSIGDYNLYVDVYDEGNYEPFIDDTEELEMTHLSFSMGNIMPLIQLSNHEAPTMQYLGATDTEFTFGFETSDSGVAAKFDSMNKANQELVRANRFKNGIGFLKIENELVQLTGTKFVIMNDVTVSTMPGFPGNYSITVTCTSYDSAQKETEKLIAMRPFKDNRLGTRDDLVSMENDGMANKIEQDCAIQERFQELEMYPDLHLPTYIEIDEVIAKVKKFRTKNNVLEPMLFETYPRHSCIIPGSIKEQKYEGYVDPDFYVMSLSTLADSDMTDTSNKDVDSLYSTAISAVTTSTAVYGAGNGELASSLSSVNNISTKFADVQPMDIFKRPTLTANPAIEPTTAYGWEDSLNGRIHTGMLDAADASGTKDGTDNTAAVTTSGTSATGAGADPSYVAKKTGVVFVDFLCDRADAGCGYCWGAYGEILTEDRLNNQFIPTFGRDYYISGDKDVRVWMGKQVFDCSGFVSWGLNKANISGDRYVASDMGVLGSSASMDSLQVGDVLYSGSHTGVYIGDGQCVHASSTKGGVKYSVAKDVGFTQAVRINDLATLNSTYLTSNPGVYGAEGADILDTSGITQTTDGAAVTVTTGSSSPYSSSQFTNNKAGTAHGGTVSSINMDTFGKDFIEKIATIGANKKFTFDSGTISEKSKMANDPEHVVEYMFVDQIQYSMKGLLARAFPSYLLVILDEQADWVDRKKLWTNYYVSRAAVDINIHEAYDSPINVATATLTNFYSNLTHLKVSKSLSSLGFDDDEFAKEWLYRTTGTILDEEITDKMISYKNKLYDDIYLEEGARVHIRLGYGSNPARYPISFNGSIVQIDSGETVTFVAQSDGTELTNQPLTDKSEDTNADLGLDEEVSDIVTNLLVARESDFLYTFTDGFFKYKSRYGIEHFGTHMNTEGNLLTTGIVGIIDNAQNYQQYDIVKNIYKGTYDAVPFCRHPYNVFDDETNFRFFCSGKTVWDVLKMCEKALPEFVAYPRYFNFEQRLFYGVPSWLYKYKYNKDGDALYEQAKSFAQVHQITSLDSIIDNRIKLDTRRLSTNFIGIYSLGGDLSSTPVIMSDKNIDWSKQKTKTIDTTSVQDFGWLPSIVDKLLSWTGAYDNGKQLAIMTCVSELIDSWKNIYTGNILVLGQPEIKAHDYVYMNDDFLHMNGMFFVREVVHSMSVSSGFLTNITPGLIANNTLKQSGMGSVVASASAVAKNAANMITLVNTAINVWTKGARGYKAARLANYTMARLGKAKNFINGKGKVAYSFVKDLKIVTKGAEYAKEIKTLANTVKAVKSIATIFETGEAILIGVSATFPPALIAAIAIDILLNIAITWIYDMFAYNNTISLNPLMVKDASGQASPFVGNVTGQKTLLPGASGDNTAD